MKTSLPIVSFITHRTALCLTAASLLAIPIHAQPLQGTLAGSVLCNTDPATPLAGITVTARMLQPPGSPVSSVTDSNGLYSLNVMVGFYEVTLATVPTGLTFVTPATGTNLVPVAPGMTSPANFVLSGCVSDAVATLGDTVWLDVNCDGIQDVGEPGLPGVSVKLLDCQGTVLAETLTDEAGHYLFEELPPGDYALQFVAPDCHVFTHQQQGDDPERDSDADPATGLTECFSLAAGQTDLSRDAGLCAVPGPGVRSQGYWKNHASEWPVEEIEIGGTSYDRDLAVAVMRLPTKGDKRLNMFEQLVAAKLNVARCNESSCIAEVIELADLWMEKNNGPVPANSPAWKKAGSDLHFLLDSYNSGLLCAPSAD